MDPIHNPYSNSGQMTSSPWQNNPPGMPSNPGAHGIIQQQLPQTQQPPQQMPPMQHQMQQQQPPMMHQAQRPPQMHSQQPQQVNLPQMMPQQPSAPQPQQPPQHTQMSSTGRMQAMPPMQQPTHPTQPIHPHQPIQQPTHGPHQPQQPQGQQVTLPSQPTMPNTMILCRLGQDTVQDIVAKTTDLFNLLKMTTAQLPNGTTQSLNNYEERKTRIIESLRSISINFKRLKTICDKINEGTSDIDFVQPFVESLIPIVGSTDRVFEEKKKNVEVVKRLTEERNALAEQVKRKNQQVKEVIDMLRDITWDINTMLAMRKP